MSIWPCLPVARPQHPEPDDRHHVGVVCHDGQDGELGHLDRVRQRLKEVRHLCLAFVRTVPRRNVARGFRSPVHVVGERVHDGRDVASSECFVQALGYGDVFVHWSLR